MFKRLILVFALGAALVACSPAASGTSGAQSPAPIESSTPSDSVPSESPAASAS